MKARLLSGWAHQQSAPWWAAKGFGSAFCYETELEVVWLVSGRGEDNRSRIGLGFQVSPAAPEISWRVTPLLDIHDVGPFGMDGISYPWLVVEQESCHLYFVGWRRREFGYFDNQIGAVPIDRFAWRVLGGSPYPVVGFATHTGFGFGSCSVEASSAGYTMFYTHFTGWRLSQGKPLPFYDIRMLSSNRLDTWEGEGSSVWSEGASGAVCRPAQMHEGASLLFSSRSPEGRYRIRIGRLQRGDSTVAVDSSSIRTLKISPELSWFSRDTCYAAPTSAVGTSRIAFSGNNFGLAGIGLAELSGCDSP